MKMPISILLLGAVITVSSIVQAQSTSKIAFTSHRDNNTEIYIMDDDGGNPENLTNTQNENEILASICSDGTGIAYVRDSNIWFMKSNGGDQYVIDNSFPDIDWGPDCATLSGTDVVVYIRLPDNEFNQEMRRVNADGSNDIEIADDGKDYDHPSWCANQIMFSRYELSTNRWDIYMFDQWGQNPKEMICWPYNHDFSPECSLAVRAFAFSRATGSTISNIFRAPLCDDGCCEHSLLTTAAAQNLWPTWSPGGTTIAFSSNRQSGGGDYEIYKMDGMFGEQPPNGFVQQLTINDNINDNHPDWGEITP